MSRAALALSLVSGSAERGGFIILRHHAHAGRCGLLLKADT
jgi:hypothetical protein